MQLNHLEIRTFGLQRSGNHAIINWIASQTIGNCVVLNDCEPRNNPFESMQEYCEYYDGKLETLEYTWGAAARRLARSRAPQQREVLIHSYEDRELSRDRVSESWVGRSNTQLDVLIVRDPLNFFASRLRVRTELTGLREVPIIGELWKKYIREAVGETSILDPKRRVVIEFGKWKDDAEYRRQLAFRFNLPFSDRGVDTMIRIGPGSSFEYFEHSSNASKMEVNQRWKFFIEDPEYKSIVCDEEVRELSMKLFGPQAGWDKIAGSHGSPLGSGLITSS